MSNWNLVVLALIVGACGGPDADAKAPAFNVMKKGEIHATMWQLTHDIDSLDSLMRVRPGQQDAAEPGEVQSQTVRLLERITASTELLRVDRNRKAHPLLAERIEFFRQTVGEALEGARRAPPNYYYAGAVAGACVNCHDPRGGLRSE